MKTVLRKIARFSFALIIPTAFLIGCQEDIEEPYSSLPKKSEIKGIPK